MKTVCVKRGLSRPTFSTSAVNSSIMFWAITASSFAANACCGTRHQQQHHTSTHTPQHGHQPRHNNYSDQQERASRRNQFPPPCPLQLTPPNTCNTTLPAYCTHSCPNCADGQLHCCSYCDGVPASQPLQLISVHCGPTRARRRQRRQLCASCERLLAVVLADCGGGGSCD